MPAHVVLLHLFKHYKQVQSPLELPMVVIALSLFVYKCSGHNYGCHHNFLEFVPPVDYSWWPECSANAIVALSLCSAGLTNCQFIRSHLCASLTSLDSISLDWHAHIIMQAT